MLDINHILSVVTTELNTFNAVTFLSSGFYVWVAYKITGSIEKVGFKIFWVVYALLHLYKILQSSFILYNPFFHFAIAVFFLQVDFIKYTRYFIDYIKDRAYNKHKSCVDRNFFIEKEEEKVKRENKIANTEALKQKQQSHFLEKLSKKLDF